MSQSVLIDLPRIESKPVTINRVLAAIARIRTGDQAGVLVLWHDGILSTQMDTD